MRFLLMVSAIYSLVGLAIVQSATANDTANLIARCDRMNLEQSAYGEQIGQAKAILRRGKSLGDVELEARGLIRMAFIELDTGNWGAEWEQWRDRALALTKHLDQSNIAKAEVQGYNGYLRAMYFREVKEGIADLRAAVATAETIEHDAFLIRGYYFLGRVLVFDGQDANSLASLRLSARFARECQDDLSEFEALQKTLSLTQLIAGDSDPAAATKSRIKEVAERLGRSSPFLMPTSKRVEATKKRLDSFEQLRDKPLVEVCHQLSACTNAARFLVWHCDQLGAWEQSERYLSIYESCAERLQNESAQIECKFLRAGALARKGEIELADEMLSEYAEYKKSISRTTDLPDACIWMAKQLQFGGNPDEALKWHELAEASRDRGEFWRNSMISADEHFTSLMKARQLRLQIRSQEKEILNQTWFLFSLPMVGLCLWLVQLGYQQRSRQKDLQTYIDQQTESLRLAKEQAESQNLAKTEYIARINHEIRNPLTAIIASSELIAGSLSHSFEADDEARETLRASTHNLLDLINDVLDFTQIESGKLTTTTQTFSPAALLQSVAAIARPQIASGVRFIQTSSPDLPHFVAADEAKIRQVLINIAQNSARHTKAGLVELGCEIDSVDAETAHVKWTVKDSGIGMSKKQLNRLFNQYESDQITGTGLGLYISKAFVDCMDGAITCTSAEGHGTTTFIRIPCKIVTTIPAPTDLPREVGAAANPRVLVIDDELANRVVLGKLLERIECDFGVAGTWREAEPLLKSRRFDIVLLDLRMPDMDGFEVFRRITELYDADQPLVFAMTGDVTEVRRLQVSDAGFAGFLAKPFTMERLQQTVHNRSPK